MGAEHQRWGSDGERLVASLLEADGSWIVARNHRSGPDEIDLIVEDRDRLVAVEVKSTTRRGVDPLDAVDDGKLERVRRGLAGFDRPVHRIDLVGVAVTEWGVEFRRLVGVGEFG